MSITAVATEAETVAKAVPTHKIWKTTIIRNKRAFVASFVGLFYKKTLIRRKRCAGFIKKHLHMWQKNTWKTYVQFTDKECF